MQYRYYRFDCSSFKIACVLSTVPCAETLSVGSFTQDPTKAVNSPSPKIVRPGVGVCVCVCRPRVARIIVIIVVSAVPRQAKKERSCVTGWRVKN